MPSIQLISDLSATGEKRASLIPNRLIQLIRLMPFMMRENILKQLQMILGKNFPKMNGRYKRSLSATFEKRASLIPYQLSQLSQLTPFMMRGNFLKQLRKILDKNFPNRNGRYKRSLSATFEKRASLIPKNFPNRNGRDKWNGANTMKKRYNPIFYPNRKRDDSKFYNTPKIKNLLSNLS